MPESQTEQFDWHISRLSLAFAVVVLQQPATAAIYGIMMVSQNGRIGWFFDYFMEYIEWRIRGPTNALTPIQKISNVIALVILVAGAAIIYRNVTES